YRHIADSAKALGIERHARGERFALATAQRPRLGRVEGGKPYYFCGIAVVTDAEKRAVAVVIVMLERAAVLVGIAAEITQCRIDRRLPAFSGGGVGADQRAIGAQHGSMGGVTSPLV